MKAYIFDTSVWINFLNGKNTKTSRLLLEYINSDEKIFLTPLILLEILQGIRDDKQYSEVKDSLLGFDTLILDPIEVATKTSELFRKLKKKGVSVKKTNDCIIAFYAIHFDLTLVHSDKDFEKIAKHTNLKTITD